MQYIKKQGEFHKIYSEQRQQSLVSWSSRWWTVIFRTDLSMEPTKVRVSAKKDQTMKCSFLSFLKLIQINLLIPKAQCCGLSGKCPSQVPVYECFLSSQRYSLGRLWKRGDWGELEEVCCWGQAHFKVTPPVVLCVSWPTIK